MIRKTSAIPLVVISNIFAIFGVSTASAAEETKPLVTVERGDLPIILSAPHGGRAPIPDVPPRQGVGVRLFNPRADIGTERLTEELADRIETRLGQRPYVVIARFHRKYVDANRPPELAHEGHANARAAYDAYHAALAEARREVTRRWGRGVVFDVHGQAAAPLGIYRGTQNGETVRHLIDRFGKEALTGDLSVFGQFDKQGIEVFPPIGSGDRETRYTGGFITVTYGSGEGGTVDAIQLEFGRGLRAPGADTAEKAARAIGAFAEAYLPMEELESPPVRVGIYRDVGAGRSVTDLMRALHRSDGLVPRSLTAGQIRSGALSEVDVLIQPGGSGSKQGMQLGVEGRERIRAFLRDGGGYIGICAGAYLATADYDWSLHVLDARVLDRKHWARGTGTVEIELSDAGRRLLKSDRDQLDIYYGQGPLLAPAGDPEIEDYEVVATYRTEIAKNGAPEGVMKGTTAIAQGTFGRGRVVCFSPHPEKTGGLGTFLKSAIDHVHEDAE